MKKENLLGVINAGGKSRRMGQNKALIQWEGKSFLERAAKVLQANCASVIIIANDEAVTLSGIATYPDQFPNAGPMGGIVTALHLAKGNDVLVLGCDMPLITQDLIQFLIQKTKAGSLATIPVAENQIQPLCAYYSPKILPEFEKRINQQQFKLTRALQEIQPDFIPITPQTYLNYHAHLFFNVNTPEDLDLLNGMEISHES